MDTVEIIKEEVFVRENPALVNNVVSIVLVSVTPRENEDDGDIWTLLVVKFS